MQRGGLPRRYKPTADMKQIRIVQRSGGAMTPLMDFLGSEKAGPGTATRPSRSDRAVRNETSPVAGKNCKRVRRVRVGDAFLPDDSQRADHGFLPFDSPPTEVHRGAPVRRAGNFAGGGLGASKAARTVAIRAALVSVAAVYRIFRGAAGSGAFGFSRVVRRRFACDSIFGCAERNRRCGCRSLRGRR